MIKCEKCNKEFNSGKEYAGHKTAVHSKVSCGVCSRLISTCGYKKHLKFHQRILIATCKNERCNKEFSKGYEKQLFCSSNCANHSRTRKLRKVYCGECHLELNYKKPKNTRWLSLCKDCILKNVFINDIRFSRARIKRYIQLFNLKDEVCAICNTGTKWYEKPISLHIHHKNADRKDNRLENLDFMCPNCHSQTENYGFKNRKHTNTEKFIRKYVADSPRGKALAS